MGTIQISLKFINVLYHSIGDNFLQQQHEGVAHLCGRQSAGLEALMACPETGIKELQFKNQTSVLSTVPFKQHLNNHEGKSSVDLHDQWK